MGSWSQSVNKDQRTVIEGATQATAPESQLANPFGVNIMLDNSSGSSPSISYGGVEIHQFPDEVNALVNAVLASNKEAMGQVVATVADIDETTDTLVGTIEGIKTPLAKFLPFAVIAAVAFVIVKLKR